MKYLHYLGIDISKEKIDVALLSINCINKTDSGQFANSEKGFKKLFKWLKQFKVKTLELLVSMEHTGVYTIPLCLYMEEKSISYMILDATNIKYSLGIRRDKSDKTDAIQIARYSYVHREHLRIHTIQHEDIRELKLLFSYRDRLKKIKHILEVSSRELKAFELNGVTSFMCNSSEEVLESVKQKMKLVEKRMLAIIHKNKELKRNYDLIVSVPGIGFLNAVNFLVVTQNFVRFENPKQFACFAVIAPFGKSSGKSIKGQTKVSHRADKKTKTLLSTAVCTSLKRCKEYKDYYERQMAKGKNEYSVKNAVRNKIVTRVFAVVKRQQAYIDVHQFAA